MTSSYRPGYPALREVREEIYYPSAAKARKRARSMRDRPDVNARKRAVGKRISVYECPHCGAWHMTHRRDTEREET